MKDAPRVFISYARCDRDDALKLYERLSADGFAPWIDERSMPAGARWRSTIENALRGSDFCIAMLSPGSVDRKGYVQKEIRLALDILDEYPEDRIFLIPIRLAACTPSHPKLLDLNYTDFFPDWENGYIKVKNSMKPDCDDPRGIRVSILIGHSLEKPLPRAVEMAKHAAIQFKMSSLELDISIDLATRDTLRRELAGQCDLLIYYGHGSRDGNLIFTDGPLNGADCQADPVYGDGMSRLACFLVFACFGSRFARSQSCPWVAFDDPILQTAPRGFMHTLVKELARNDFRTAFTRTLSSRKTANTSSMDKKIVFSEKQLPPLVIARGAPHFSRLSPAIGNTFHWEIERGKTGQVDFSAHHDPFVGRMEMLSELLKLPEPDSDFEKIRTFWVHGDPGMGKSALLRQFALSVHDTAFHDHDEPVWLLHMYCCDLISTMHLRREFLARASKLYELRNGIETVDNLACEIEIRPGRHVWIFDDVSYSSSRIDDDSEVENLFRDLIRSARSSALTLQVVVSSRRSGPVEWRSLKVEKLAVEDAVKMAEVLSAGADRSFDGSDRLGAELLFSIVRNHTGLFKRSLVFSLKSGMGFQDYADCLQRAGTSEQNSMLDLSRRMFGIECGKLKEMESRNGFSYTRFLGVMYELVKRCGWFTLEELDGWFKGILVVGAGTRKRLTAYENGIKLLAALGLLSAEKRDRETVYVVPPNQRTLVQSIGSEMDGEMKQALAGVPVRAISHTISMALERLGREGPRAVVELLSFNAGEYAPMAGDVEVLRQILGGLLIKAELYDFLDDRERELAAYDDIVMFHDDVGKLHGYSSDEGVAEQVATALCNKGVRLGALGRTEEEIAVYEAVDARYGG
ncbi:toll/interleukin-1 receptor domain-containing protein, partial [bacterium]|nr:toll/interleukin-1 receptor domain-containing protein [candidate division CSSED10-310 bacterium]